jgi:hypothetical protein
LHCLRNARFFDGGTEFIQSLSVKTRSKTVRFLQYTVERIQRRRNFVPFHQKRRVKRCIFGENTVFVKFQLCKGILNLLLKILEILDLSLVDY